MFPQIDEKMICDVLLNKQELNRRIYEMPTSAIKINNKRINYFDFISSLENEECNKALIRIVPRINMEDIYKFIEKIPLMTTLQQEFYKTILKERKEKILDYSYNKLMKDSI